LGAGKHKRKFKGGYHGYHAPVYYHGKHKGGHYGYHGGKRKGFKFF
jgi:hypothetical protein